MGSNSGFHFFTHLLSSKPPPPPPLPPPGLLVPMHVWNVKQTQHSDEPKVNYCCEIMTD